MKGRKPRIHIDDLIESAWESRDNQDIPGVLSKLETLRGLAAAEPATQVEILFLQGSVERAHREMDASRASLAEATRLSAAHRLGPLFSLSFQTGIQLHLGGDLPGALERFVIASRLARTPRQRGYAMLNSIICLIHLGLPHERTLEDLGRHLVRHPARSQGKDPLRGVRQQFDVIRLRKAWADADWQEFAFQKRGGLARLGAQGAYLRLYASEHPIVRGLPSLSRSLREEWSLSGGHSFQQGYRMRTLRGAQHPSEDANPQVSELADRLHLWVWRWLDTGASYDSLVSLLATATRMNDPAGRTFEDEQLLRNSLLWIGLRDPETLRALERFERRNPDNESPLLSAERDLAHACHALKRGSTEQAKALARSVERSRVVRDSALAEIARFVIEGATETSLQRSIATLIAPPTESFSLRIDPEGSSLLSLSKAGAVERKLASEPMCRAFALLRARESVTCEGFLDFCFGIPRYDSLIHQPKIFNLLARMREIAPSELRLGVKSGRVFSDGSWARVDFLPSARLHPSAFVVDPQRDRAAPLWKLVEGRTLLKRAELEGLVGKSKATAHRLIQQWVREGILIPRGAGRGARYEVRLPRNSTTEKSP